MSDDIKKHRSPSAPRITLAEAVDLIKKLYSKAGKSPLSPDVAVQALGYTGLNGAALGILASLKQYGLVSGERGGSIAVSPLAIRLLHPITPTQEDEARREAALSPKVFAELMQGGYAACSQDVLANHLRQNGFTFDGAARAASVFKDNEEFAKLGSASLHESTNAVISSEKAAGDEPPRALSIAYDTTGGSDTRQKVREYRFALDGDNEVELRFFGDDLGADQIEGLIDYLEVMKKRLKREGQTRSLDESHSS